jgi:hypothetical protein
METSPEGQCWIRTDLGGFITSAEGSGQRLLNLTARGARGRELLHFFVGNRLSVEHEMRGVLRTGTACRPIAAEFRPYERRATSVEVIISKQDPETLEWRFWLTPA